MIRLKYYLPLALLALALAFALLAGFCLPVIGELSAGLVGEMFPITYRIEPRGSTIPSLPQVAQASIINDQITLAAASTGAAPVTIGLNDVNLFAVNQIELRNNQLRAGLFTLLFFFLSLFCSAQLATFGVAIIGKNRRKKVLRSQKRRQAAAPRRPLPPSGPQRLPRAA